MSLRGGRQFAFASFALTAFSVAPRLIDGTVQPRAGLRAAARGCVSTTVTSAAALADWPAPSVAVTVIRVFPSGRSSVVAERPVGLQADRLAVDGEGCDARDCPRRGRTPSRTVSVRIAPSLGTVDRDRRARRWRSAIETSPAVNVGRGLAQQLADRPRAQRPDREALQRASLQRPLDRGRLARPAREQEADAGVVEPPRRERQRLRRRAVEPLEIVDRDQHRRLAASTLRSPRPIATGCGGASPASGAAVRPPARRVAARGACPPRALRRDRSAGERQLRSRHRSAARRGRARHARVRPRFPLPRASSSRSPVRPTSTSAWPETADTRSSSVSRPYDLTHRSWN